MCGVRITNSNRIPQVTRSLRELGSYSVEVGIFGSDDSFYAMIAGVHEFGVTILKETGNIIIPERSFLRSTFDEKSNDWYNFIKKRIPKIITGGMKARQLMELLGAKVVSDIQKKIKDIQDPPNAPSTIVAKGSSNPLIDTGGLRMRVTYRVVSR